MKNLRGLNFIKKMPHKQLKKVHVFVLEPDLIHEVSIYFFYLVKSNINLIENIFETLRRTS